MSELNSRTVLGERPRSPPGPPLAGMLPSQLPTPAPPRVGFQQAGPPGICADPLLQLCSGHVPVGSASHLLLSPSGGVCFWLWALSLTPKHAGRAGGCVAEVSRTVCHYHSPVKGETCPQGSARHFPVSPGCHPPPGFQTSGERWHPEVVIF